MKDNQNITITVYQRKRRLGTKGKVKGPGHAKSVTKLVAELELGSSLFQETSVRKESSNTPTEDDATIKVVTFENVPPKAAVLFLDRFERQTDNIPFNKRVAAYTESKQELLKEYGVKTQADLTDAAKVRYKREMAKKAFYYYEYQAVVQYGDKKIHSHRMKAIVRRTKDSWSLPKVDED